MATVIKTTFQLKRGTAAKWVELNPVLAPGEPGFEYDTKKLKIGDGVTAWLDLPYVGSNDVYFANTSQEFPETGNANRIYKASDEKALYQWNASESRYEPLSQGEVFDPLTIKIINGGNAND